MFAFSTLPDGRYLSPPTHPLLLPLLVNMAMRPPAQQTIQNVEIGEELTVRGPEYADVPAMEVEEPGGQRVRVEAMVDAKGRQFAFADTLQAGLYRWRKPGDTEPVALSNVQLPAGESDLIYKPSEAVVSPSANCIVVRSYSELQSSMARLSEPAPRWTWPIAFLLLLICFEAMLGSMSEIAKPCVGSGRPLRRRQIVSPELEYLAMERACVSPVALVVFVHAMAPAWCGYSGGEGGAGAPRAYRS